MSASIAAATNLVDQLRRRVSALELSRDELELELCRTDIFYVAEHLPLAVARPSSVADVQALVHHARDLKISLAARGAGLSYSAGYIPHDARTVIVDLRAMNRIIEVNEHDRYVTVEPGVTWSDLRDALQPLGLTTPFWGTFSGRYATIGASLSQGAKFFGSASRGTSAESVLGLKVVTGTGELLVTGSAASTVPTAPFFRNYGPDLTGLFLGDCGAFGFKVEITLQLIPAPAALGTCTFSFEDPVAQMNVMGQIGSEMLATECQGMDPFTARARMSSEGLASDIKTLLQIMVGSGGVIAGMRNGVQIALNGRRFVNKVGYLMNCVTEGRDAKDANARVARVRSIARAGGGKEIPASIPKVLRAMPFPRMNGLLTPSGKRMNWLHTVVPNSLGGKCFQVTEDVFRRNADLMKAYGIDRGYLLSTHGPSGVGVETLIRWSDAPYPIHTHYMTDAEKAALKVREDNPRARQALEKLSGEILREWRALGGVHMQVGRKYPYLETRLPETASFLRNLKSILDPDGIMNPGNVFTDKCDT